MKGVIMSLLFLMLSNIAYGQSAYFSHIYRGTSFCFSKLGEALGEPVISPHSGFFRPVIPPNEKMFKANLFSLDSFHDCINLVWHQWDNRYKRTVARTRLAQHKPKELEFKRVKLIICIKEFHHRDNQNWSDYRSPQYDEGRREKSYEKLRRCINFSWAESPIGR